MDKQPRLDEFVREFLKALPEDLRKYRDELEHNARAALRATLARTELVTREEFDIQAALLSRTRALVEELEGKVRELEARLHK
jgi:BMFP domain-containing protein YqiC